MRGPVERALEVSRMMKKWVALPDPGKGEAAEETIVGTSAAMQQICTPDQRLPLSGGEGFQGSLMLGDQRVRLAVDRRAGQLRMPRVVGQDVAGTEFAGDSRQFLRPAGRPGGVQVEAGHVGGADDAADAR